MLVSLFTHTAQGTAALRDVLAHGVGHGAIHVIGDLGAAAGSAGAEQHVTFDVLHLPVAERGLYMDTIRAGGVVLAVQTEALAAADFERIAAKHDALSVIRTGADGSNPSHNAPGDGE